MKVLLVLSFLILGGLTHQQIRSNDTNYGMTVLDEIAKIIRILIKEYIKYFADITIVKKANLNLTVSNVSKGYLIFSDLILYGLDGLKVDPNKTDLLRLQYDHDSKVFTIGSNISIPQEVGIRLKEYDLDWGLLDKIPLFGEGNLTFALCSIKVGVYAEISFAEGFHVDYLEIRPHMSAIQFIVTGFWKVPDLNNFLSTLTTIFADAFALFWEFEIELITCLISRLLQFILNNETDLIGYMIENCGRIAASSQYPIVESLFNSNQSALLEYTSEANILKYAKIASEYLEKELEAYIMVP